MALFRQIRKVTGILLLKLKWRSDSKLMVESPVTSFQKQFVCSACTHKHTCIHVCKSTHTHTHTQTHTHTHCPFKIIPVDQHRLHLLYIIKIFCAKWMTNGVITSHYSQCDLYSLCTWKTFIHAMSFFTTHNWMAFSHLKADQWYINTQTCKTNRWGK